LKIISTAENLLARPDAIRNPAALELYIWHEPWYTYGMKKVYKQGTYEDRKCIEILNKNYPKDKLKAITVFLFKTVGRAIQKELSERALTDSDVKQLISNILLNPPAPPAPAKPVVLTREEIQAARDGVLSEENQTTSKLNSAGLEVVCFSERGMKNLHSDDNDLFEQFGKDEIHDHEDDGRIYKSRTLVRLSDGKKFYYNFTWNPEPYDVDFSEFSITAIT
jgi:hypothetical protein